MEFCFQTCVHGYHVYGEHWTAFLGEQLICQREVGNVANQYAVAVKKDSSEAVEYVPKKISRIRSMFLQHSIIITVTGHQRYWSYLVQGGLEIPCNVRCFGKEKFIVKL